MDELMLPLPTESLPEGVRRFVATDAPTPARMMAAKGMVPLKGPDLLTVLVQLAYGPDPAVAEAARATLGKMPDPVLVAGVEGLTLVAILHGLGELLGGHDAVLERIAVNPASASETIAVIARSCSEHLAEVIAVNQQRILSHPRILEALYKNKNARMSTVDRLVELAARNGVELEGIPAFKFHVEALQDQLIPEASDEPLPSDQMFIDALAADSSSHDVVDETLEDGAEESSERLRDEFRPLSFRIREMTTSEKIRFAVVGDAAARALLVRDPKKAVYYAAISSPAMTETEATAIAHSKEVAVDVLRYIGNRKEWLKSYDIKRVLAFNPKTPTDISMRFLSHLRPNDLKSLSQSRGVPSQLKILARSRLEMAEKKG